MSKFLYVLIGAFIVTLGILMLIPAKRKAIKGYTNDLRQIDRTENVGNRIASNSFFESAYAEIRGTVFKIKATRSEDEKTQLSFVLADQVAEYNAKARTITIGDWRSMDLPYQIDVNTLLNQ